MLLGLLLRGAALLGLEPPLDYDLAFGVGVLGRYGDLGLDFDLDLLAGGGLEHLVANLGDLPDRLTRASEHDEVGPPLLDEAELILIGEGRPLLVPGFRLLADHSAVVLLADGVGPTEEELLGARGLRASPSILGTPAHLAGGACARRTGRILGPVRLLAALLGLKTTILLLGESTLTLWHLILLLEWAPCPSTLIISEYGSFFRSQKKY